MKLQSAVLLFLALCSILGCSNSGPKSAGIPGSTIALDGDWEGTIKLTPDYTGDQKAIGMFIHTGPNLEVKDGKYNLDLIIPRGGSITVNGKSVTLTPETLAGKRLSEAKNKRLADPTPFNGTLSDDGQTLTLQNATISIRKEMPPIADIIFTRPKDEVTSLAKSTITKQEAPFVGIYRRVVDTSKLTDAQAKTFSMAGPSYKLILRSDNTFSLKIGLKFVGTWKLEGGDLNLYQPNTGGTGIASSMKVKTGPANTLTLESFEAPLFTFVKS